MANFAINVKINIEDIGRATGGGGGTGSGGGPGTDFTANIGELRKVFASFSADIRTIATSLKQITTASAAVRTAGGGAAPSSASGSSEAVRAIEAEIEAKKASAKASQDSAAASEKEASAEREKASATSKAADSTKDFAKTLEELVKKAEETGKKTQGAIDAEERLADVRSKALRALAGTRPERLEKQLNPAELFERALSPLANNPDIRRLASSVRNSVQDIFKIDAAAPPEARRAAEKVGKIINRILNDAADAVESGADSSTLAREVQTKIRKELTEFRRSFGNVITSFDLAPAAAQRVAAKQITFVSDRIEKGLAELGQALDKGASDIDVAKIKGKVEELVLTLERLVGVEAGGRAGGRNILFPRGPGGAAGPAQPIPQAAGVLAEVNLRAATTELSGAALKAFDLIKTGSREMIDPAELVRRTFRILATDLKNFPTNLRNLSDALKGVGDISFDVREQFLSFREAARVLGGTKRGPGGLIKLPTNVDPETSQTFAQAAISQARQRVARQGTGAAGEIKIPVVDALRGVQTLKVSLTQLGDTLETVRVKARATSDNMFDRTSVKSALQRVATWGAAASIVFGTVAAFRSGVRTVIETESAVVALGKVMDEAAINFSRFEQTARGAAVAISQEFGQPLQDVLQTMIIFGQQGRNLAETIELTRASALAANVTTLDQPTAASALTAVTEQFGKSIGDASSIVDSFNEVANNAAITETDLAEAIKRAGLAASTAGVNFDQFNGLVAAIGETTRQSGSEIGTALRFIFARLQTNEAEEALARVGINLRNSSGEAKGFVQILKEINGVSQDLSDTDKTRLAIGLSETRRFNTLLALIDNFDKFQEAAADSANSAGSALKEQARIAETAAFRIQQLKTSLAGLAISFGDAFLTPLKLVVEGLRTFVDVLSLIPTPFKVLASTAALGTIAFAKFSNGITEFLGLADATKGAFGTIGSGIKRSLTQGTPEQVQSSRNIAEFTALGATTFGRGTIFSRTAGDFGGSFSKTLKDANKVLIDNRGNIVKNTESFSKFSAIVRGFKVGEVDKFGNVVNSAALGVNGLTGSFSKLLTTVFLLATSITRLPIINRIFSDIEATIGSASRAGVIFANTLRLAGAGLAIFGIISAISKIKDIATESGKDIQAGLRGEITEREQNIAAIERQRAALGSLDEQRNKLARTISRSPDDPLVQDAISRGNFRSPLLQEQRFLESQQKTVNETGFANPQLIDSIDEFGNVTLKTASAFTALADSAVNAEKRLLALSRVKVVEGFIKDLRGATGFRAAIRDVADFFGSDFGKTLGDKFNQSLNDFRILSSVSAAPGGEELGITRVLSSTADKLSTLKDEIDVTTKTILEELNKLPSDVSDLAFRKLTAAGSAGIKFFESQAKLRTNLTGQPTTTGDVVNRLFLQNRGVLRQRSVAPLIGFSAEETLGSLNENRIIAQIIQVRENIAQQLEGVGEGDLILFPDVEGIPDQVVVKIAEDGRRKIQFIDDKTKKVREEFLENFLSAEGIKEFKFIDTDKIAKEINSSILEIGRQFSGAGRGSLLRQDLDLGATFGFELSGQQRTSLRDERLTSDLLAAQRELERTIEGFTQKPDDIQEGGGVQVISPQIREEVRGLAVEFDKLASITKFRIEIENVGKAFEQAIEEIERNKIGDVIVEQFSGIFGAGRGLPNRRFDQVLLPTQLSGEQRFNAQARDLINFANALSESEKASGEFVKGLLVADRNVQTIFREFQAAQGPGGIRDPERLSALAQSTATRISGGLEKAESLQIAIAEQSLKTEEDQLRELQKIADASTKSPLFGARLSEVASRAPTGATRDAIVDRLNNLSAETLASGQFTESDLTRILSNIPRELVPAVAAELDKRRASTELSKLSGDFKNIADEVKKSTSASSGGGSPSLSLKGLVQATIAVTTSQAIRQAGGVEAQTIERAFSSQRDLVLKIAEGVRQRQDRTGKIEITKEESAQLALALADSLKKTPLGSGKGLGEEIAKKVSQNDEQILSLAERAIRSVLAPVQRATPAAERPLGRDIEQEQSARRDEIRLITESTKAFQQITKPIIDSIGAIISFGQAASEAAKSISDSVNKAIEDIQVGRQLSPFTGAQFGLLRGTQVPNVQLDSGRELISQLSGGELTALENPALAQNLTDANSAFAALVEQLRAVKSLQSEVSRNRSIFQAEGNVQAVQAADTALGELSSTASLVENSVVSAQKNLQRFGESFRNLEVINQLRVDVEKLFESFKKQQALEFDETSIQSALGKTVFSFTRPTFEQFEQGQKGFLTAFQRTLEDISTRRRTGELDFPGAQRETRRAEFQRNEEVIALAQQRENQRLQAATETAKQVQSRLFDFEQLGGPRAGIAEQLRELLTSELESAGDLTRTAGTRQIRNPLTGQDVNVPASQLLEFRGVPSLGNITKELAQLAKEAQEEQAQKNADLITQPLLDVLNKVPTKLDEIAAALKDNFGGEEKISADQSFLSASNAIKAELPKLAKALETGDVSREEEGALSNLSSVLSQFDRATVERVLDQIPVALKEGNVSLEEALKKIQGGASPGTAAIIENLLSQGKADQKQGGALGDAITTFARPFIAALSSAFNPLTSNSNALANSFGELSKSITSIIEKLASFPAATPEKRAAGGLITGPGGPRSDTIPMLASPGEFVVKASSVNKLGIPFLNTLNSFGIVPGFQTGGLVSSDFTLPSEEERIIAAIREKTSQNSNRLLKRIKNPIGNILSLAQIAQEPGGTSRIFHDSQHVLSSLDEDILKLSSVSGELGYPFRYSYAFSGGRKSLPFDLIASALSNIRGAPLTPESEHLNELFYFGPGAESLQQALALIRPERGSIVDSQIFKTAKELRRLTRNLEKTTDFGITGSVERLSATKELISAGVLKDINPIVAGAAGITIGATSAGASTIAGTADLVKGTITGGIEAARLTAEGDFRGVGRLAVDRTEKLVEGVQDTVKSVVNIPKGLAVGGFNLAAGIATGDAARASQGGVSFGQSGFEALALIEGFRSPAGARVGAAASRRLGAGFSRLGGGVKGFTAKNINALAFAASRSANPSLRSLGRILSSAPGDAGKVLAGLDRATLSELVKEVPDFSGPPIERLGLSGRAGALNPFARGGTSILAKRDFSALNAGIFARREALNAEAKAVAKSLGGSRSTGAIVSEARRLGLSPEEFVTLDQARRVLGLKEGPRVASGELQAKPFNRGRFQPATSGRVALDRKFKSEIQKKIDLDREHAALIVDELIAKENIARQPFKSVSDDPFSRTPDQVGIDVQDHDIFLVKNALNLLKKGNLSADDLFRMKEIIESSNFATVFGHFRFGKRGLKELASGGAVSGPGGPRSDRVPILASNGEFVLNSNSVNRLGLPVVEFLNSTGKLPGFQDGGLVGKSGGGALDLNINLEEISSAIKQAVIEALESSSVGVDAGGASKAISDAVQAAFNNVTLPSLEVNTDNLPTIKVDVPNSIPLDTSALERSNLGNSLGADIRNRLEAIEGSVQGVREDTNGLLDKVSGIDNIPFETLTTDLSNLKETTASLSVKVDQLDITVKTQREQIISQAIDAVNREINNLFQGNSVQGRLDTFIAQTNSEFIGVRNSINEAISIANRAMTQSLGRR